MYFAVSKKMQIKLLVWFSDLHSCRKKKLLRTFPFQMHRNSNIFIPDLADDTDEAAMTSLYAMCYAHCANSLA